MSTAVNTWHLKMKDARQIWQTFCRDLEAAGSAVFDTDLVLTEMDEAESVRYLSRLLRIGLEMHLENADASYPTFYQASHETAKIGADNPDNHYQNATINGSHSYRIHGYRGTVPILSFATKANRYAIDGSMASTGELDSGDMEIASDGSFEITVSRHQTRGNWLPLEEDSSILIVRQTFFDRTDEILANVAIESVDCSAPPAPITLAGASRALQLAPAFINGTARTFVEWAVDFRNKNNNRLSTLDQSRFVRAGGDPTIHYLHGWWELSAHQRLEISSELPVCEGWNFQLNNVWMESLDYRHHQIHLNNKTAVPESDGRVKIVVAHEDPGHPNWIRTTGHPCGTMLWRWTSAQTQPVPEVEVVSL